MKWKEREVQSEWVVFKNTGGVDWQARSSPSQVCQETVLSIECLRALTTDAAGELDVLGHDGHALGVDGAQVGVLEETNQVSLTGLLK